MNTSTGSKRQYTLAEISLAFYLFAGALIALILCYANGDLIAGLGVFAVFGMQAVVLAFGGSEAEQAPVIQRRLVLGGASSARPARELATQSGCWQYWPKNSGAKEVSTRSMCWRFWPESSHEQAFAR